jgi:CRP-like cAMP-binding protein
VLAIKRIAMEELLLERPALLQEISRTIDERRAMVRAALSEETAP